VHLKPFRSPPRGKHHDPRGLAHPLDKGERRAHPETPDKFYPGGFKENTPLLKPQRKKANPLFRGNYP